MAAANKPAASKGAAKKKTATKKPATKTTKKKPTTPGKPSKTGKKVGSGTLSCEKPPPKKPQPTERCDFDLVVFKCSHCPATGDDKRKITSVKYWMKGAERKNNLQRPPKGSRRQFTNVLEVVAFSTDSGGDEITILLKSNVGYHCSKHHPWISVFDETTKQWVVQRASGTTKKFKAKSVPLRVPITPWYLFDLVRQYFFPLTTIRKYTAYVRACGGRGDGKHPFTQASQIILAYPADSFKLSVSIPSVWKRSHTREGARTFPKGFHKGGGVDRVGKVTTENTYAYHGVKRTSALEKTRPMREDKLTVHKQSRSIVDKSGQRTMTRDRLNREKPIQFEKGPAPPGDTLAQQIGATFTFERTGEGGKVEAASIGELIKTIFTLSRVIQSIANFIKDFQPQFGWKFIFEVEVCKGTFNLEWGRKEWVDHTVYNWWKFYFNLVVFSVKLELSFGASLRVKGLEMTGVVFGTVLTDLSIKGGLEANPDNWPDRSLTFPANLSGEIGIRLVLGDEWAKAEGKFVIGFPGEATIVYGPGEPVHVAWRIDYTGITSVLSGSVKWCGSFTKTWELTKPAKPFRQGTFFKGAARTAKAK